jgi:hypothetical protein
MRATNLCIRGSRVQWHDGAGQPRRHTPVNEFIDADRDIRQTNFEFISKPQKTHYTELQDTSKSNRKTLIHIPSHTIT